MDYIYTAFHQAHVDGTPVVHPLWAKYPKDVTTFPIDLQWFFGDSVLVSPVTEDDSTSVTFYLPNDIFYDFNTLAPVQGHGATVTLTNVSFTEIPLHIKGGSILPLRANSAMTTSSLRENDFEFVVAPGSDGKASGQLYIDDGVSITQKAETQVTMTFAKNVLDVYGTFAFHAGVNVSRVRFLGVAQAPREVLFNGKSVLDNDLVFDTDSKVLDVHIGQPLTGGFSVFFQ